MSFRYCGITVLLILLFTSTAFTQISGYLHDEREPDSHISVSSGMYDVLHKGKKSLENRLEFRNFHRLWEIRPLAGIMFNMDEAFYLYGGLLSEITVIGNLTFIPSFCAGYYRSGRSNDLGYDIEFRTQVEFTYEFPSGLKIGTGYSHISNADLGNRNKGVESLIFSYYMPLLFFE